MRPEVPGDGESLYDERRLLRVFIGPVLGGEALLVLNQPPADGGVRQAVRPPG